jgi:hypothetical protein
MTAGSWNSPWRWAAVPRHDSRRCRRGLMSRCAQRAPQRLHPSGSFCRGRRLHRLKEAGGQHRQTYAERGTLSRRTVEYARDAQSGIGDPIRHDATGLAHQCDHSDHHDVGGPAHAHPRGRQGLKPCLHPSDASVGRAARCRGRRARLLGGKSVRRALGMKGRQIQAIGGYFMRQQCRASHRGGAQRWPRRSALADCSHVTSVMRRS